MKQTDTHYDFSKIVLWGTGVIGKRYYALFSALGYMPMMFIDNDPRKNGGNIDNIPIYTPEVLTDSFTRGCTIMIACKANDEVYGQLLGMGIAAERIISLSDARLILQRQIIEQDAWNLSDYVMGKPLRDVIAFDLSNGTALGGVERWSLTEGEKLRKIGKTVSYILGKEVNDHLDGLSYAECFQAYDYQNDRQRVSEIIKYYVANRCGVVISNFCATTMLANSYYKKICAPVRHIMVIHSDDTLYYQMTVAMHEYIDFCLVISNKIREKLIAEGFPQEKIMVLNWNIPVKIQKKEKRRDGCIRIGYAGRITKIPKRLDYIPKIIETLNRVGVNYQFEIAGIGDYYQELEMYVKANNLEDKMILLGLLDANQMVDFWGRQDIYFSCSDWEGHSISQCEAIAAGAVPVATDVSGARDDIEDGVSGYIIPVGNWKMLADKIIFLSRHTELLDKMSQVGMENMRKRNRMFKDNILQELCDKG